MKPCRLVQANVSDERDMSIFSIKYKYPIPYRLCVDSDFIFFVLLTVHLTIILVINQLNAQNLIICLCMFRILCVHYQEVKTVLYSIWYRHTLQMAVRCAGWERTLSTCAQVETRAQVEWVLSQPVHRTATYRVWWFQMLYNKILNSWWWAQQCSKHVEAYNKLIIKQDFVY